MTVPLARLSNGYRWLVDPYRFLDAARASHGLTFRCALPTLGRPLITGDPRVIREILRSSDLEGGKGVSALRPILGDHSMITLTGRAHRSRRRLITPCLRERSTVCHDSYTIRTARELLRELPAEVPFSAYELLRRISLRVIVRVVFGRQSAAEARRAESLVAAFLDSFKNPLVLYLRGLHFGPLGLGPWGQAMRNLDRLRRYIRRRIPSSRPAGRADGILAHMLWDGELSEGAVTAEILALLLFGHETGAATMAWALAHLCAHPRVIAAIRREAEAIRARRGRLVPEEHSLLEACLLESMRLCPVVVHLTRIASRDLTIGGQAVKAGERVLPCAYLAQRNPAVFPRPDVFEPERFLDREPPRYSYFPFGFGSRTCPGKPFVSRHMCLVVSTLVSELDLTLAPGYRCRPVRQLLLIVPREGTLLVKRERS